MLEQAENVDTTTTRIKTDKNVVKVEQDPMHFGFWRLSLERGSLPRAFQGVYTKRIHAEQAAELYAKTKIKE